MVDGVRHTGGDNLAFGVEKWASGRPCFVAVVVGINIHTNPAADIVVGGNAPEDFPSAGIVQLDAGWIRRRFMDGEHFQPRTAGIDVRHMHGVAVAQSGGIHDRPIIIDGHSTVNYLVPTVSIHIGDGKLVVALARGDVIPGIIAVEHPNRDKLIVHPVEGGDHRSSVVASGHQQTRPYSIQICHSRQEAVHPVAVAVAPSGHIPRGGI